MSEIMNKKLRVTMPDGSKWDVPISIIAKNRAEYYATRDEEFNGDIEKSLNEDTIPLFEESDFEIRDWAAGSMNWSDVEKFAVESIESSPLSSRDFQDGWLDGEKEVMES